MDILKFFVYGVLSNIICCLGLMANMLTLYILNASKDMRKLSINIYLTVLTMYDNGVLIFSVMMLNIPAMTDYHYNQQHQNPPNAHHAHASQQGRAASSPPPPASSIVSTSIPALLNIANTSQNSSRDNFNDEEAIISAMNFLSTSNNSLLLYSAKSPVSIEKNSPNTSQLLKPTSKTLKLGTELPYNHTLSMPIVPLTPLTALLHRHTNHLNNLLNNSFISLKTNCLVYSNDYDNNNITLVDAHYKNQTNLLYQFDSNYCKLLYLIDEYFDETTYLNRTEFIEAENSEKISVSKNDKGMFFKINADCELMLNRTIALMNKFSKSEIVPNSGLMEKYFPIFKSVHRIIDNDEGDLYEHFCHSDCSIPSNYPLSPLVYYVKLVYPLALIAQTGSIWTTCLITIERYLAVCHPLMAMTLSTRARAIWALSILFVLAFLFNLPRFAEVDTTCYQVRATELRRNKIYYQVYYIFLNLTFNYIIPLSLLSALNIKIYASVRQATANRNELTRARRSELHMASMLVAIVAIFIACNAPAFVVNCLEPYFEVGTPVLELLTIFSNVLVCFNSSINFVIYCIFGAKFRQKFIQLLRLNCFINSTRRHHRNQHFHYNRSYHSQHHTHHRTISGGNCSDTSRCIGINCVQQPLVTNNSILATTAAATEAAIAIASEENHDEYESVVSSTRFHFTVDDSDHGDSNGTGKTISSKYEKHFNNNQLQWQTKCVRCKKFTDEKNNLTNIETNLTAANNVSCKDSPASLPAQQQEEQLNESSARISPSSSNSLHSKIEIDSNRCGNNNNSNNNINNGKNGMTKTNVKCKSKLPNIRNFLQTKKKKDSNIRMNENKMKTMVNAKSGSKNGDINNLNHIDNGHKGVGESEGGNGGGNGTGGVCHDEDNYFPINNFKNHSGESDCKVKVEQREIINIAQNADHQIMELMEL